MAALSIDLRQRVLEAMRRGESPAEAAERFEIHPTTARAWRRLEAAGQTAPRKVGAKPICTKLTDKDLARLRDEVEARPGVTLRELVELIGGKVVQSTICRALIRMGYRFKKRCSRPGSASGRTWCAGGSTSAWPAA